MKTNDIYNKIGGRDQLFKIVQTFYKNMLDDIMIGFFFKDKDINHIINQQVDFLSKIFGGPQVYSGQSPQKAHQHLNILSGHFHRRLQILQSTLESLAVHPDIITQWVKMEESFFTAIVKKKGS